MAVCENCGNEITEGKKFCNVACELEFEADHDESESDNFQKLTPTVKQKWS